MTHLFSPEALLAHSDRVRRAGLAKFGMTVEDVAGNLDWTEPPLYLITTPMVELWAERDRAGGEDRFVRDWGVEDLYTPRGMAVMQTGMIVEMADGAPFLFDLVTWIAEGDVLRYSARDSHEEDEDGNTTAGVVMEADTIGGRPSFPALLTLHACLFETITRVRDADLARGARRRLARLGVPPPDPGALSVVTLRNVKTDRDDEDGSGFVDWSHRWEVRGHFRRTPSGGKTYVRPHIKGPIDKPLVTKRRVYRWSR